MIGQIGAAEILLMLVVTVVVLAAFVGLVALGVRIGTRGRRA